MANVAIYDQATSRILNYLQSVNTPDYSGRPDVLINPDVSQLTAVPQKYWKRVGSTIISMTAPEIAALDAADAAAKLSGDRAAAVEELASTDPSFKLLRAALFVLIDELNLLRQRDNDRSVDVAAATTLADLKSRWALRASLPDRTAAQAKTAVQSKINAGDSD